MALQEGGMASPHPKALPHAVTEQKARVEHRHDRPLARHEFAVDPDEDALVARVVLEVVRAVGDAAKAYGPPEAGRGDTSVAEDLALEGLGEERARLLNGQEPRGEPAEPLGSIVGELGTE
jgi:hypothetical protein